MGRWMSPDWSAKEDPVPYAKLDDPQTLNLYGYVGNNPLSKADADGHVAGVDDAVEAGVVVVAFAALTAYAYEHTPAGQRSLNQAASFASGKISDAFHSIFSKSDKPAPAAPIGSSSDTPTVAPAAPGTQTGSIYVVPGSATASGKPYVGRHNKPNPARIRRSKDGRDRSKAVVVDTYPTSNAQEGREKEQEHIDTGGGKEKLDNKRNEIKPTPQ